MNSVVVDGMAEAQFLFVRAALAFFPHLLERVPFVFRVVRAVPHEIAWLQVLVHRFQRRQDVHEKRDANQF